MRAFVSLRGQRHHATYESCYKRITARNWNFVVREAAHRAISDGTVAASAHLPCKVRFDWVVSGQFAHVVFMQCLVDDRICLTQLHCHPRSDWP